MSKESVNNIEVILFDLGNVLVDLGGKDDFTQIFSGAELTEVELWEKWLRSVTVKAFDSGKIDLPSFVRQLLDETGLMVEKKAFTERFIAWPKGLFQGALELVARIPPHYHLAVLSNTNDAHWGRLMDEMGLAGVFHSYFASHQMGLVKPDKDVYEHVINALGVEPSKILFMDDNWINVETARASGMCAEQVKGIAQAKEMLYTYGVI